MVSAGRRNIDAHGRAFGVRKEGCKALSVHATARLQKEFVDCSAHRRHGVLTQTKSRTELWAHLAHLWLSLGHRALCPQPCRPELAPPCGRVAMLLLQHTANECQACGRAKHQDGCAYSLQVAWSAHGRYLAALTIFKRLAERETQREKYCGPLPCTMCRKHHNTLLGLRCIKLLSDLLHNIELFLHGCTAASMTASAVSTADAASAHFP